jgi:hypothetical protein
MEDSDAREQLEISTALEKGGAARLAVTVSSRTSEICVWAEHVHGAASQAAPRRWADTLARGSS